ncbi:nickel-dependent lactate racemase [Eubacterium sp. 1001713B170207_170306_E7]|uniref:nickel-dependent lactate racemase n=1 Tax=Eubacterium sp. 1001713B170207_170306_E7 TaxID=2787097 RepID=UPI001899ABB5|nr:nickel-dependent lactate racemase [Eubacterium sp. 1001713B170207_170306_E7]
MQLEFGYGQSTQKVNVPDQNLIRVLTANPVEHKREGTEAVRYALAHPIGSVRLKDRVRTGLRIAIITSDVSRPLPSYDVLPDLLDELYEGGICPENITVVFGLGSHRRQTEEEKRRLVGERCYNEVRCVDSDVEDYVRAGITANGTPVDITRIVAEADFRICLGNIEFHYFAGYSGGAKALMPGVSTPEAIQQNHRLMVKDGACAGNLADNPLRQDIEEAGQIVGVDFIVNVVLDEKKKIVYCVAGDVIKAHRAGCAYLDKMYRTPIPKRADIVIVSQGGAPKDANLYQTQKALDNAKHAVRTGGTIILIGACNEGLGSTKLEQWLFEASNAHDLIERIEDDFQLGGHKAAAIAMVLENAQIDLVSELDDALVRRIFLKPEPSAQSAFEKAMVRYGSNATVIAMPHGGATLPIIN